MKILVTTNQIKQLNLDATLLHNLQSSLNVSLNKYNITTPERLANFFTQLTIESKNLTFIEELDFNSRIYEEILDIGNTSQGDGIKYKPRGGLKLHGKNAYLAYSKLTGKPFVLNPNLILQDTLTICDSSCWYWSSYKRDDQGKTLNELSDIDSFFKITNLVENGKYKSLKNKLVTLKKCFEIFDVPLRSNRLKDIYEQARFVFTTKNNNTLSKYEQTLKTIISNDTQLEFYFKDIIKII